MRFELFATAWLVACTGGTHDDSANHDSADAAWDDDLGTRCGPGTERLPEAPTPVPSFPMLPTSNGWVSATWTSDARAVPVTFADGTTGTLHQQHQLSTFTDHVFRQPTPTTFTRDLLWDAYLGVRIDGAGTWLNAVPEVEADYEAGTAIVRIVQDAGDLRVTTRVFAPFQDGGQRDLVIVGTVENRGAAAHQVALYALHNAHTGGEGHADAESVTARDDAVIEQRGTDALLHTPLGVGSTRAAAPSWSEANPWRRLTDGAGLDGSLIDGDDVAVGFAWDLGSLGPGDRATRGTVLSWGDGGGDALASRVEAFVRGRDAEGVLQAERDDWSGFHASEAWPPSITADELAVARQSTAVLRMGQVREDGPGFGQILASLPPGGWNMSWPRDAAYAIVGLVRSGHRDMARAALDFQVRSDSGYYAAALGLDDYLISAARYYGDGTEESDDAWCPDGSPAGPNIELDDFGLFLWAYGAYADRWPDDTWIADTLPTVLDGVAEPLVRTIDGNNDLLIADSSIWERHWEVCFPNGRKQFAYSSIQAVAGLRAAARLSGEQRYADAADRIRRGLLRTHDDRGAVVFWTSPEGETCPLLASAPEETCDACGPYDGAVVDLINHGVVRPDSALAIGTVRGLVRALAMGNGSPGLLRNDDGTGSANPYPWYDDQEWVVIDLRFAAAMARIARATGDPAMQANARTLIDWVTAQARVNHDLIPELLSDGRYSSEDDVDRVRPGVDLGSEYQGAVPMCGFGPGAYILALEALSDA